MSGARPSRPKRPRQPMPPGREARPPRVGGPARPEVTLADASTGGGVVRASWVGTGLLTLTGVAGDVAPHTLAVPALVVALTMFFAGCAVFLWAFLIAIGRSREFEIGLAGVFGLSGSAPAAVRLRLFGSLAAQIVVAIATWAVRPYSTLSFGILALMWGLGLIALWGARHGAFPPRRPDTGRPGRRGA